MDKSKLDRIHIRNENELNKLFTWRDHNKDLVRNYSPVLNKGLITFGDYYEQTFVDYGNYVIHHVFFDGILRYHVRWERQSSSIDVIFDIMNYTSMFEREDFRNSVLSIHASLMAYMEHNVEFIEKKEVSSRKTKTRKKKPNTKKVTKITRRIYSISEESPIFKEKRDYTTPSHSFMVRGHWRHYKNGKKVWIESYPKNKGEKEPKIYGF